MAHDLKKKGYMTILKYHIAFFLFIAFQTGHTQEAKLSVISNSGKVLLMMNNVIQNESPSDSIHISQISEGSYTLKLLNTDSIIKVEKTIFINPDQHQQYQHSIEDSKGLLRLIGNYTELISDSIFSPFSLENKILIDSIYQFTTDSLKLNDILYSTDYIGKMGCQSPSFLNTQQIINRVESQVLTRKKREVILFELKHECVQVKDLSLILKTIEYEDSKLNIIKLLSSNIYDIENLNQLDKLFNIRGYQEAFNDLKKSL